MSESSLRCRSAGALGPHEQARAVRQLDLATAGAKRSVASLVTLDEDLRSGGDRIAVPAAANQRIRCTAFNGPFLLFPGLRRALDVQPRVRVAELHARHDGGRGKAGM